MGTLTFPFRTSLGFKKLRLFCSNFNHRSTCGSSWCCNCCRCCVCVWWHWCCRSIAHVVVTVAAYQTYDFLKLQHFKKCGLYSRRISKPLEHYSFLNIFQSLDRRESIRPVDISRVGGHSSCRLTSLWSNNGNPDL